MKTRRNVANTRLSRSKEPSDQPCQQLQHAEMSVDVKADKRQSSVKSSGSDKRGFQETSTPKNKIKKSQKGVIQTPGGRDDLICSQHFDSQVVVGWDCQSPDTLRGIKRFSGSEQSDAVSDLLSRLIEEEPDIEDLQKRSTPPLLGVWRENKIGRLSENETGLQQRLRKRGHGRRKKDSDVSRDLLKNLTRALDKCSEDAEYEEKDETLDNNDNINTRSDICPSIPSKPSQSLVINNTAVSSVTITSNNKKENTYEEISEDTWSDDDLFDDDSFIVKATQVPETFTKFVSPVFGTKRKSSGFNDAPKSKTSRYTFQLEHDSGSLGNKKLHCEKLDGVHSKQNHIQNVQTGTSCKSDSSTLKTATNSNYKKPPVFRPKVHSSASNVNISRTSTLSSQQHYPSVSVSSKIGQCAQILVGNPQKSVATFKHNPVSSNQDNSRNLSKSSSSFTPKTATSSIYQSRGITASSTTNSVKTVSSSFTSINDGKGSFKKHNSFSGPDMSNSNAASRRRSVSGGNCSTMPIKPSIKNNLKPSVIGSSGSQSINRTSISTANVTNQYKTLANQNLQKSGTSLSCLNTTSDSLDVRTVNKDDSISCTPAETSSSGIQGFYKKKLNDSGFDTSISDDLLCQLAEPDDMLDNLIVDSTVCGKPSSIVAVSSNISNTTNNPVIISKHPMEKAPNTRSTSDASDWGQNSEDLFASDDDYDDDGLTEPEVLAMLDEVELLATQQSASQKQLTLKHGAEGQNSEKQLTLKHGAEGQNSEKQLTLKHGAEGQNSEKQLTLKHGAEGQNSEKQLTLKHGAEGQNSEKQLTLKHGAEGQNSEKQLTLKHGAEGQNNEKQLTLKHGAEGQKQSHMKVQGLTEAQGYTEIQGQLNGSQESSSQNKYSQADIEKKKQDALARRKMKMKK